MSTEQTTAAADNESALAAQPPGQEEGGSTVVDSAVQRILNSKRPLHRIKRITQALARDWRAVAEHVVAHCTGNGKESASQGGKEGGDDGARPKVIGILDVVAVCNTILTSPVTKTLIRQLVDLVVSSECLKGYPTLAAMFQQLAPLVEMAPKHAKKRKRHQ